MVAVVGNDFYIGIAGVECGLENFYLLAREFGSLEATDEFLGLAREHRTADDLYAATACGFHLVEFGKSVHWYIVFCFFFKCKDNQ